MKTLTQKAKEFLKATRLLLTQGPVKDHVADFRLTVCTGLTANGKRVSQACVYYDDPNKEYRGSGYCTGCECPEWKGSRMNNRNNWLLPGKAWYPIKCPQDKFSAMPGRRVK